MLVSSHGSEFDQDFVRTLTKEQVLLRQRVLDEMHRVAAQDDDFILKRNLRRLPFITEML